MSTASHPTRRQGLVMYALAALALLGLLWLYFENELEERRNPNRNLVVAPGSGEMTIQRNRAGHYLVPGRINGQAVSFLLDTGATQVAIPAHLGPRLGLVAGRTAQTHTANGTVIVRQTTLDSLILGPFELRGIPGQLNPGQTGEEVLLGMSALRHLEFTQRGDTLILRPHSP